MKKHTIPQAFSSIIINMVTIAYLSLKPMFIPKICQKITCNELGMLPKFHQKSSTGSKVIQDISGPRQKFKNLPDHLIVMVLEFSLAHILLA
jgi:hypothetical protein